MSDTVRVQLQADAGGEQDAENGSIFFIGTATVIIKYAGFTILTDPNFLHAGDHVHLGYGLTSERLTEPAINIEEAPVTAPAMVVEDLPAAEFQSVAETQPAIEIPALIETQPALDARSFVEESPVAQTEPVFDQLPVFETQASFEPLPPFENAAWPKRSYFSRLPGSERTWYASDASLKRSSDSASPGFWSG